MYVGVRDRQHKSSGNSRSKGGGTGTVMHYLIELNIILTQKLESIPQADTALNRNI